MKRKVRRPTIAATIRRTFLSREWRDSQLRNVTLVDSICGLTKAVESLVLAIREGGEEEEEAQNQ
jgi:hypothetical protein